MKNVLIILQLNLYTFSLSKKHVCTLLTLIFHRLCCSHRIRRVRRVESCVKKLLPCRYANKAPRWQTQCFRKKTYLFIRNIDDFPNKRNYGLDRFVK